METQGRKATGTKVLELCQPVAKEYIILFVLRFIYDTIPYLYENYKIIKSIL